MVSKNIPSTFKGGIQTHTYELSKQLSLKGHKVSILMSAPFFKSKIEKDEAGIELVKISYLPGRYIPYLRLFLDELFFNVAAYFWILRNASNYDIIHLQGRSGFLYSLLPLKTPFISTYHGLVSKEQQSINSKKLSLQYKIYYFFSKKIESISLRKSKKLIVVSESLKNDIAKITSNSNSFTIVPNGVNIPQDQLEHKDKKMNIVTYIGRVEKTKGVHDLIHSIEQMNENVKCIIIGEGEYSNELKTYLKSNPILNHKVWMLGSLTSENVNKWISLSNVVVLPSYYETQGIVLLEANAYGKPVIASNIEGIKEVVENGVNGLLYEKGNVNELTNKIKTILNNKFLSNTLGQNGLEIVRSSYSWDNIVNQTEQIYKSILV